MKSMLAEPSLLSLSFLLLVVLMIGAVLVAGGAFLWWYLRRDRGLKTSPPAQSPPIVPATQVTPRKCPQCGATLQPDVPEGLCPACLLQRGFATEGGAPPGSPPFVPPTIPELAKLFPQLEIMELIGKGGMGAVYKARQPALDRFVALKILAPRSGGDLDFAGRFSREARALARLSHPNIVGVYDFGEKSGHRPDATTLHYFIMEFVDGPNLRQAGKLTPRQAMEIIPQICAALQFAHDEGIVHRDIKPENVLLDRKGRVKIADFGLAKILGQEQKDLRLTGVRDVMGTPHYMAPEQLERPQDVDHRADIYSLGVVFYELLTGELPLGKFQSPSQKVAVDVRLDEVVLRSLAREPELRYQHVSEVGTRVQTIAGTSAPAVPAPAGPAPRAVASAGKITAPAVALMVAAAWKMLSGISSMVFLSSFHMVPDQFFGLGKSFGTWGPGAIFSVAFLFELIPGGLILFGGYQMLMRRSYAWAIAAGILAIVSCSLISLPIGIWALIILTSEDVKAAFGCASPVAAATTPPRDRFWRRFAVVMACVVLIPVAIAILGTMAAMLIPAFVKGRQHAQAIQAQNLARHSQTNQPPASLETWSPVVNANERPDLEKIRDEARTLATQGRYEEALQRRLWYHNHALEIDQAQTGVRLSFALSDWVELGRHYPKAKQALVEIRDHQTRELAEGRGHFEMFSEVEALNRELQTPDKTYALFKKLESSDPQLAGQCYFWVESALVQKGEYETCLRHLGDPQRRFEILLRSWKQMKTFEAQGADRRRGQSERYQAMTKTNSAYTTLAARSDLPSPPPYADPRFIEQTRQLIEILVATDHKADAEKIRDQAVELLDDARLKNAVSDAEQKIRQSTSPPSAPGGSNRYELRSKDGAVTMPMPAGAELVSDSLDLNVNEKILIADNFTLTVRHTNAAAPTNLPTANTNSAARAASLEGRRGELLTRYSAAQAIVAFSERDTALTGIVRDAARAGNFDLAKRAVEQITAFSQHDSAALQAARELAKNGRRDEAIAIAKGITSFAERDAALKELAR